MDHRELVGCAARRTPSASVIGVLAYLCDNVVGVRLFLCPDAGMIKEVVGQNQDSGIMLYGRKENKPTSYFA